MTHCQHMTHTNSTTTKTPLHQLLSGRHVSSQNIQRYVQTEFPCEVWRPLDLCFVGGSEEPFQRTRCICNVLPTSSALSLSLSFSVPVLDSLISPRPFVTTSNPTACPFRHSNNSLLTLSSPHQTRLSRVSLSLARHVLCPAAHTVRRRLGCLFLPIWEIPSEDKVTKQQQGTEITGASHRAYGLRLNGGRRWHAGQTQAGGSRLK